MIEGVCRVCGSPLAVPIVRCPACDTPHHQDCWAYNRGCSIFGCSPALSIKDVTAAEPQVSLVITTEADRRTEERWRTARIVGAAAFGGVWLALGLAMALKLVLPAMAAFLFVEVRRQTREAEQSMDAGRDPREALELERKAVAALLGARVTEQLAQVYALFEQRHPRDRLPVAQQRALAIELVDHGYWALGLEALDKALKAPGVADHRELAERQRLALLRDPAYLIDALCGVGQPGAAAAKDSRDALAPLRELPDGEGPVYLLALAATGWGQEQRAQVLLPSHAEGPRTIHGQRLGGPMPRDRAAAEMAQRWSAGFPCVAVPAGALALPPIAEDVHEVHLSQNEARFRTAIGERVVDWRQIKSVVFARLEKTQIKREVEVSRRNRGPMTTEVAVREVVDSRPLVEVHYGPGPTRLRFDQPRADMFNYMGRRREMSHAANMAILAKDLARFGPGIRVSHGLSALFAERVSPGLRFSEMDLFEEYVLWFWALGSDAVRARWRPVQEALGVTP